MLFKILMIFWLDSLKSGLDIRFKKKKFIILNYFYPRNNFSQVHPTYKKKDIRRVEWTVKPEFIFLKKIHSR